jgi:hypothetical protein
MEVGQSLNRCGYYCLKKTNARDLLTLLIKRFFYFRDAGKKHKILVWPMGCSAEDGFNAACAPRKR